MATITAYPTRGIGMVTPNQNTAKPPSDIGPNAWEPPDDTYTEVWRTTRPDGPPFFMFDVTYGNWFDGYPTNVRDITPRARVEVLRDNTTLDSRNISFEAIDLADLGAPSIGRFFPLNSTGILPAIDTIVEVTGNDWIWQDADGGTDKARLISVLIAGNLKIQTEPPSLPAGWTTDSMSWGVRVHEFGLTLTTAQTSPAPLRLYPRSSTRLYPRRRTRRPGTF